jgi:hypothetical protein
MPTEIESIAFRAIAEHASLFTVPIIEENEREAAILGTGTLFHTNDDYFLITAQHVGKKILDDGVGIPERPESSNIWTFGPGQLLRVLQADLAVFCFRDTELIERLKKYWQFLTPDRIWLGGLSPQPAVLLHGYPIATSHIKNQIVRGKPASFVTGLYEGDPTNLFIENPYDPNIDLILQHTITGSLDHTPLQVLVPRLNGISGCSVWAAIPECEYGPNLWSPQSAAKVIAVETSYIPGVCIRTRKWANVISMISQLDS